MRQTNAGILRCNAMIFRIMLGVILILLGNAMQLHADITTASLQVTAPAVAPARINGSANVTLKADWAGDTPPFSASFKTGDSTFGNETTSANSATFVVSGAALGHGDGKSFKVVVLESSVPYAESLEAPGDNTVNVDLVAPKLTVSIANGPNFSNTAPNNVVRIRIEADEDIRVPTVSPVNGVSATQEGGDTYGKVFYFTLTLTDAFGNGDYTVSVTAKDTSEPETSANTGSGNTTFKVGTGATGDTTIESSTPASPTNSPSITLTGKAPNDAKTIEILDGATSVATTNISAPDWTIGLSPDEGVHNYVAVSRDSLNAEISRSSTFAVTIDRTVPAAPVPSYSGPATTNQDSVTVEVAISDIETEVSKPVKVQVYVNGVAVGTPTSASSSPVSVSVPLGDENNRITFEVTDAAGNKSAMSDGISVYKDVTAAEVTGMFIARPGVVASMPLPLDPLYFLGAGSYKLQVSYGKDMKNSVNPVITVLTGGGSTLSVAGGSWVASRTFIADITVPKNGGASYDGVATVNVSGAEDASGNSTADSSQANAFSIDSSDPVASFDSTDSIYVSASSTQTLLKGEVVDSGGSGVGNVTLVWQSFTGGDIGSTTVPIMEDSPSPWEKNWDVAAAGLAAGRYKLWVAATDRAKPTANREDYSTKPYRILIYDNETPIVSRIALGNMAEDINELPQPVVIASAVTRLTARFSESGDSGIDFTKIYDTFTLVHDETGTNIRGNYSNNSSDTAFFDFPELTLNGTYTVSVTPFDQGGNQGDAASRSFILDKEGPSSGVVFYPADQHIANNTHVALAQDQVWATINDTSADYTRSTIEVRYNGEVAGTQDTTASTTAVVWDLYGTAGTLANNQSHDGRYDITVVPIDTLGNTGSSVRGFFNYDSVPPVVTANEPVKALNGTTDVWFGLDQSNISVTVSDAPKDAIQYGPNMPVQPNGFSFTGLQVPGDPNWYNGNGSGFNAAVSSFSWTMGDTGNSAFSASGNVLTLPRPNPPADTSEGMSEVIVSLNLKDQVNDGEQIPNSMTASYSYKFDYLIPKVTSITKPESGDKYCKNVVNIAGTVMDQGGSDEVMVTSIEYSQDGGAWSTLTASGLPAKSASFSANIDISSKADGTYSVNIRAKDLGNNLSSETPVSYVVDRTPPPAPSLIVPLPALKTKNRGQLFKWAAQTDADHYLLQVADDASFNNILNHQTPDTDYTGLTGQVLAMTEGAFSVPKDGTYYWRVASIETCTDGYNISSFSETRSFTVDTVKPLVVEVQPAPSQGNKITTGMVTFTIRFSELVDTTISPLVKLTTAGGQMMMIEKVSYVEDTWTGTTVIPIDSSALYDGSAIISIEGGADLAGNVMSIDSSNSVVINTGPAFTTRIFSNPANEYEIMIVTKSSEALQSPPTVSVQQNSTRTPVTMNFLKERYYAGSYKIDLTSPGKAYIDLTGTDLHGMVGKDTIEFTIADLSASQRLDITSISGNANLKGAENSAFGEAVIYMLDRESLETPFVAGNMRASVASVMPTVVAPSGSELVPVMALEEIGPSSLRLKKRLLYTAKLGDKELTVPAEKVHLYRLDKNGKWIFQGGEVKDGEISAQISGLGRFALMADTKAPALRDQFPADMERLEDSFPEIKGLLADGGSGVRRDSFKLYVDGMQIPGVKLNDDGTFAYQVKQAMEKGKHEISMEIADYAGNSLRQSFWVTAPGPFAADEFMPYPNPARGNAIYFNYNFNQTADIVSVRIYDTAGHKVASFETDDFASLTSGRFRWDLRNDSGKTVANGVYFYKLSISKGGQTFKKRGKFAVLR